MAMTIEVTSLVNENIELKKENTELKKQVTMFQKKEKEQVIKVLMDEYRR